MSLKKSSVVTRRSHKKSRNGCFACKNRRVKCDENHPKCRNCSRKGIDCVYPELQVILENMDRPQSISSSSEQDTPRAPPVFEEDSFLLQYGDSSQINFDLSRFVLKDMYMILAQDLEERNVWHKHISELFYDNLGFCHILMAVAALYHYYQDPVKNVNLYKIAQFHYSKSIPLFQTTLMPNDESSAVASMCTSVLIPIYLTASLDYKLTEPNYSRIGKGMRAMFAQVRGDLPQWFSGNLLTKYRIVDYDTFEGYNFPAYLNEILSVLPFESNKTYNSDEADSFNYHSDTPTSDNGVLKYHNAYQETMNLLFNQYVHVYGGITPKLDYSPVIIRWMVKIPNEFLFLLSKSDPRSYILVWHLLKLVVSFEGTWWKPAAHEEIKFIEKELPEHWHRWLVSKSSHVP